MKAVSGMTSNVKFYNLVFSQNSDVHSKELENER